ncbi:AraC family transcriptional regulator [Nocardia donostiensis]|uniref:HTH araC/xylS-type domain-containing protein n=1 Tax=Nocardia donostiensis TaxID=1538463 RepID=A0A1W0B5C3_9NOCA|nr:AraC family transcriptional regulator [Nocardia donostiensis]ONM48200.1 hypothetical protein B0T46_14585 [Nocardia donostiensis]OQS13809.1 hypothetical protein B0T36_16800 [Nocardia donostiensis]OQS17684.1 hypothetical protein B0T44_23455 [Nocardia donostiensis]
MRSHCLGAETLQANDHGDWSQVCSDVFVPSHVAADESFRGSIRQVSLTGIAVSRVVATPVVVHRNASLIATDPRDDVLLVIHLSGTGWVDQTDRTARLVSGTAALCETDHPYRLRFDSSMSQLVLHVPRERLRLRETVLRESTGRPIDSGAPGLTVLTHLLTGILAEGAPVTTADQLAETALALISAILSPDNSSRGQPPLSGDALLHVVRTYMQRRRTDPELDVAAVAGAHAISRRYLEQLFARVGESPAAYLRRLRLDEARRLLSETTSSITDIAYSAGFNDVSTFTRAFRRVHGITPREWRRDEAGGCR